MKLIVEGAPQHIQFVQSICRDKVRRGQLTLTLAAEAAEVPDSKDAPAADSKYTTPSDKKNPVRRTKKSE